MSDNFANINIPDAKFIYRTNFKGVEGDYNKKGDRNFTVILEGEALRQAEEYGMKVKYTKPKSDEEEPVAFVKVNVGFKFREPHIELINSRAKRILTERTVGVLDNYDFEHVEMVIRPNRWHRSDGSTGVNAYLQSLYAIVVEDPFVAKYYDIPEIGEDSEEVVSE